MAGESKVAVAAAFAGNLLIAILKLVAGLVANSAAMLAESAHSFSDTGNQALLALGIRQAGGAPSERYPYGTAKNAYFWPFMVAVLLFGVAGGYSLVEGVRKILDPHPLEDIRLALAVLAVAFVVEAVVLGIAVAQALRGARGDGIASVRQWLQENRDATLLTIIVEDTLALTGLVIAALALLLTQWTGNAVWDGAGSILIGILLMGFAVFLAYEVRGLLLGRGLGARDLAAVRRVLGADPDIVHVGRVQSMYLGPSVVLLGAEVELRDVLDANDVEAALARIEKDLVRAVPELRFIYLEPKARVPRGGPGTRRGDQGTGPAA